MTNRSWRSIAASAIALLVSSSGFAASTARSTADRVNVRSRPGYAGEIITQLSRDQEIVVLGTNTLSRPAADEPPVWLKIELPSGRPLWVSSDFVNPTTREVTADVLNVRAGPGLDFAVVGRVQKGAILETHGNERNGWIEVGAPQGSIGYVPANWVTFSGTGGQSATATASKVSGATSEPTTNVAAATTTTPSSRTVVQPPPTIASTPAPAPAPRAYQSADMAWAMQFITPSGLDTGHKAPSPTVQSTTLPLSADTNAAFTPSLEPSEPVDVTRDAPAPAVAPGVDAAEGSTSPGTAAYTADSTVIADSPPADARWVRREGLVIRPSNPLAPSFYALEARDSGKTINFLITSRPEPINWREYHNKIVIVTGREYLDGRRLWREIPLLDVEKIEAVR